MSDRFASHRAGNLPLAGQRQHVHVELRDHDFHPQRRVGDGLPAAVERQVTERWAELFRIFYNRRDKIDRVTLWGGHDGMSWRNNYPVPRRTNYPLLFGRDHQPKPAFHAVGAIP